VTTATRHRTPVFAQFDVALVVARCHADPAMFLDARLLCWVLMPDHWHGLIELGEASLPRVVNRFKSTTSHSAKTIVRGAYAIWERGCQDRAIRRDEDLVAAARYLVLNPVRAGLVTRVGDYPFWDAVWL
jgi:REP element-mobilizing transposase RayT